MIVKKRRKEEGKIQLEDLSKIDIANNLFLKGFKDLSDFCLPSAIDVTDHRYIVIDGVYVSVLLAVNLPLECREVWLDRLINFGEGVEISLVQEAQDKRDVIQDITRVLGFTNFKIKEGGTNQIDSDIQENAKESSIYLKKRLSQGDEFYHINLYVKVIADSKEELEKKLLRTENELAGVGIVSKRADYRQLEAFLTTLPFSLDDESLQKVTRRNILSSGLKGFYPYLSSSLSDKEGIFLGINSQDDGQIILDIFDTDKYTNANMIIAGKSGSGKTFTTQMITGRFRMLKIPVMLVCPLKGYEYEPLCRQVGGNFIKFEAGGKNAINIMAIRPVKESGKEKASYLADKVNRLRLFFSLIIPNITKDELDLLDDPLIRTYEKKGITMDNSSIYEIKNGVKKLKEMPILEDAYSEIQKEDGLEKIAKQMKRFITGSLNFFNNQTNVDINNLYTVCDISDIQADMVPASMFIILDMYWDKIKEDRLAKKAVVLDEVWKLIGTSGNAFVAEFVLELFKIVRGYGGAAIATTQDIADFMMLEGGRYGKGIINASNIKIIHQLEALDAGTMSETLNLSEEEHVKIEKFERGEGLLCAGNNHITVKMKAFATEERLINTDRKKLVKYREQGWDV